MRFIVLFLFSFTWYSQAGAAEKMGSSQGALVVTEMASGLEQPWGLGFLPGGGFLVTLRDGELRHYQPDGSFNVVTGLPQVVASGQGGLLDVVVAQDFETTRTLFLSYTKRQNGGNGTVLASARLSADFTGLEHLRVLFEMKSPSRGSKHFGGRIVEARDGSLFLTLGERGDRDEAQSLLNHNGAIVRVHRDGSVPASNPFAARAGALPEIWSYGHRNPQGAALDARGQLWVVEHGAKGGDEVNRVEAGLNYGWPVIGYGRHYTGFRIGEGTHKPGMAQPEFYWDPSIAPSGLMIYSGKLWPAWRGDFFVGSLKFDMISRLEVQAGMMREVERLNSAQTGRVRDVREAPDGSIWFLSVDKGAVFRLAPK